jgi:hypothetical protein
VLTVADLPSRIAQNSVDARGIRLAVYIEPVPAATHVRTLKPSSRYFDFRQQEKFVGERKPAAETAGQPKRGGENPVE